MNTEKDDESDVIAVVDVRYCEKDVSDIEIEGVSVIHIAVDMVVDSEMNRGIDLEHELRKAERENEYEIPCPCL